MSKKNRKRDSSINIQELHEGLISVAAYICNSEGCAIAVLALHAPLARVGVKDPLSRVIVLQHQASNFGNDFERAFG